MRIDAVKAGAFGPFNGDILELAPGMNVVYGPNESGKSSWHAAIYAAMCGMKRTRGQPTREDRAFANRHRPWRGTTWRVSAVISLDDGRLIEIDQSFGSGGRSVATDRLTRKALTGDIMRGGAVDAATLLGLTRETALSTMFIRQADMLRVLNDAEALQEYLERAAATSAVETTADEALGRIAAYKREYVGVLRTGARGPLATFSRQLSEARDDLDSAEERFESYQELLARRHAAELDVRGAEQRLRDAIDHENERHRQDRWREIHATRRRLEQARCLAAEVAVGPQDAVPEKELVSAVTRALAAFETRSAEPAPMVGPTAKELDRELATLPPMPQGDLEPAPDVLARMADWRNAGQRIAAHDEIEPSVGQAVTVPATPSEMRRLGDELELTEPEVDQSLRDEVARRRGAWAPPTHPQPTIAPPPVAARSGAVPRIPVVLGGVVALVGVTIAVLGQPVVGIAAVVVGLIVGVAAMRRAKPSVVPTPPPPHAQESLAVPPPDLELTRLEARLAVQEESLSQAQLRRQRALARLADLNLPADPATLRQISSDADAAASAQGRHIEWKRRRDELEQRWSDADAALRTALESRGMALAGYADLEQAFDAYVAECRQRDGLARQASRRPDLAAQLAGRRSAETSRDEALASRASVERQLLDVAHEVGYEASDTDGLVVSLRNWLRSAEQLDEIRQKHAKTAVRLDQLLDGRTLGEFETFVDELSADAGDPLSDDAPGLDDRSVEVETLRTRVRERSDALAELIGQIEGADAHLLDVSVAVEAEARADAEVRRLEALAADLDLATEILVAAQQKVHADIAPILNDTIRSWVPRITRGRYDDIRVDPATLELEAHEANGHFRPATVLSHGTTEQLFLLLRLALAKRLSTTGERAPLVLDDVTVQSDADRTVAALDLLHELSAEHQVVLFTQEDEVLRWAEVQLQHPADRLIRLVGRP